MAQEKAGAVLTLPLFVTMMTYVQKALKFITLSWPETIDTDD